MSGLLDPLIKRRYRCPGCHNELNIHLDALRVTAVGVVVRGQPLERPNDETFACVCPVCRDYTEVPALADRGTRPTWDKATDEQILEEIDAVIAAGYTHVAFGTAVRNFLVDRGLWDEVMRRVNVRPA